MSAKKLLIAAAAAAVTLTGTAGIASAHGGKHFFFGDHHPRVLLFLGNGGGCGYAYEKWQYTGSFYWKREYYICRGWW